MIGNNLSVKIKSFVIIGLLVTGLIIVDVLSVILGDSISGLHHAKTEISELHTDMLTMRRHEKDFLMRKDDKYVDKMNKLAQATDSDLRAFSKEISDLGINASQVNSLRSILDEYNRKFNQMVGSQKKIGYDHESGLYGALRSEVRSAETIVKPYDNLRASMLMLRRHEKDFMLRRDLKYVDKFQSEFSNFKSVMASVETENTDEIMVLMNRYEQSFGTLIEEEKTKGLDHKSGLLGDLRGTVHKSEDIFGDLSKELDTAIESKISSSRVMLTSITTFVAIVISVLVFLVAYSIFKPLGELSEKIVDIAKNRDLTVRLPTDYSIEISQVATSFNTLVSTLQGMVTKVDDASNTVVSSAEEMSVITKDVKESSSAQAEETTQASVSVNQMSQTIQEIARNAAQAAESVSVVDERLQEGTSVGAKACDEIQLLTSEVEQAAQAIQELEKNSENIGQVLDAIQSVAEQTNLLALNAAIEAARAGEQGRGFAVVADEVRTLAKRTQESTETIRQTIAEFQQGTSLVVATVSKSNERAESGIQMVTQSTQILSQIAGMVSEISNMNTQIASAAEEQGVAADEINNNVNRVKDLSDGVARQSDQTSKASHDLAELGHKLHNLVLEFKVK